jgi:hypothetical protein
VVPMSATLEGGVCPIDHSKARGCSNIGALRDVRTQQARARYGSRRRKREDAMTITGGCRCGAVRYKIDADRITARHCWCRDCQYIGAGSGTVNVFFPSKRDW